MKKHVFYYSILALSLPLLALAVFDRDLYFGLRNDAEVTKLQEFLRDQGVYTGPITGNFFNLTLEGVKKFQEREGISPVAGYFGPKSRTRAEALLSGGAPVLPPGSPEEQISKLLAQIKALQEQLKKLQEEVSGQAAGLGIADTVPPSFTRNPRISRSEFLTSSPPLGAKYPYKIVLDWAVDETGVLDESITCVPTIKIERLAGRNTEYFPAANQNYSCIIAVKDQAGNSATYELKFDSPSFFGISGIGNIKFPETQTTPLKIGEITLYNGSTSPVTILQIATKISEDMNSPNNRGKEVFLVLRKGTSNFDEMISRTSLKFNSNAPSTEPHRYEISMPFSVALEAGEEKTISLWVELLDLVLGGSLSVEFNKFITTAPLSYGGGFKFTLTR